MSLGPPSLDTVIAALDLPQSSRVDRRIPKKLLLENGAPTAADKRRITAGVERLEWLAALKPANIGVPGHVDASRAYEEIAVVVLTVRGGAGTARLVELVHRAIPYPVLLLTKVESDLEISAVHKRWSHSESGKTVLDGDGVVRTSLTLRTNLPYMREFQSFMSLRNVARHSLYALYQGWIYALQALEVAGLTGRFRMPSTDEEAAEALAGLQSCRRLDDEIARLRTAAAKEGQMRRRVEINIALQRALDSKRATLGRL